MPLETSRGPRVLLLVLVIILAVCVALVIRTDYTQPWRAHQKKFRSIVKSKFGPEKAAQIQVGIQQIWIPDLGVTDRCVTCHMGEPWKGLEDQYIPYASHSRPELISKHPFDKFGCTFCHGGQGYATEQPEAHGWVEDWQDPRTDLKLAESYLLKDTSGFLQLRCNYCHRYEHAVKGMEFIDHAKELVRVKGCRACHTISGFGGNIGPDLTYEGDKPRDQYDFTSGAVEYPSVFNWHIAHFRSPKSVVPTSIMPEFQFSTVDLQSLTLLALSWRKMKLPVAYMPHLKVVPVRPPEEIEKEKMMLTGPGAFFVKKGCFGCHTISTLKVESPTNIGPDLALAEKNVPKKHNNLTVPQFLHHPQGTMAVIFGTPKYHLSEEEKKTVAGLLQEAYDKLPQEKKQ